MDLGERIRKIVAKGKGTFSDLLGLGNGSVENPPFDEGRRDFLGKAAVAGAAALAFGVGLYPGKASADEPSYNLTNGNDLLRAIGDYKSGKNTGKIDAALDNFVREHGNEYHIALSCLVFREGETRAYQQLGWNTDDSFGMAGKNIRTLKQVYDTEAFDTLTFLELLQKTDNKIDIMDHDAYGAIERTKERGTPNQLNNTVKQQELVRVDNKRAYDYIKRAFGGELDGVSLKDLKEMTRYCPPESQLNPMAGNFYLQMATSTDLFVRGIATRNDPTPPLYKPLAK